MAEQSFTIRLVTPAFIGGGEDVEAGTTLQHKGRKPRHRRIGPGGDSLRIPSLRGVLRFWLRAKEDPRSLDALQAKETMVFGSADGGQGLRIRPVGRPHWTQREIEVPPGDPRAYLGYGPLNFNDQTRDFSSHNKFSFRDAIPENTSFSFCAVGTRGQVAELRKCLLLLHLFSGIGARSRRGWGSVEIVEIEEIAGLPQPERPEDLAGWFAALLGNVWESSYLPSRLAISPSYSAFSDQTGIRLTPVLDGDYGEVFSEFHRRFADVRLWDYRVRGRPWRRSGIAQNDHDLEQRDAADPNAVTDVPQRLAYGLPYAPKSRNAGWEIAYHGRLAGASSTDERQWTTRRASPLFLKVHRFAPNRHFGVALHLDAQFFGDSSLQIGAKDKPNTQPPPGPAAIQAFLNNPSWTRIALP